jgi:hypothetical protein
MSGGDFPTELVTGVGVPGTRRAVVSRGKSFRTALEILPLSITPHVYEMRPRKDHRGVNLISDALPFGRLWYSGPNAAINAID